MDENKFWRVIEAARPMLGGSIRYRIAHHSRKLIYDLARMGPKEIIAFDVIFTEYSRAIRKPQYRSAAQSLLGQLTEDGFMDFCSWVISLGREAYFQFAESPESLADMPLPEGTRACDVSGEAIGYAATEAYEMATGGQEIPVSPRAIPTLTLPQSLVEFNSKTTKIREIDP